LGRNPLICRYVFQGGFFSPRWIVLIHRPDLAC
jgi:hypothetical protein